MMRTTASSERQRIGLRRRILRAPKCDLQIARRREQRAYAAHALDVLRELLCGLLRIERIVAVLDQEHRGPRDHAVLDLHVELDQLQLEQTVDQTLRPIAVWRLVRQAR